jgi:hypothetical protein
VRAPQRGDAPSPRRLEGDARDGRAGDKRERPEQVEEERDVFHQAVIG